MKHFLILSALLLLCLTQTAFGATSLPEEKNKPQSTELSYAAKQIQQQKTLEEILTKYSQNQTFVKLQQYMNVKFQQLEKGRQPRQPAVIIKEAFQKSQTVYEKTKPFVGNSFQNFDPDAVEHSIERYLWLKGLCFFLLGINQEHEIGLSYFYLAENQGIKKDFLRDIIHYSFPEVPDIPANRYWYQNMTEIMDRLGYKIFNIQKYVPTVAGND